MNGRKSRERRRAETPLAWSGVSANDGKYHTAPDVEQVIFERDARFFEGHPEFTETLRLAYPEEVAPWCPRLHGVIVRWFPHADGTRHRMCREIVHLPQEGVA
jgi:hypothetical protein